MHKTLAEIARIINGEVVGDKNLLITGLSGIKEAKPGDLTFLANPKYIALSQKTKASAIITGRDTEISHRPVILTENPSLAFSSLIAAMTGADPIPFHGIHCAAFTADDADIGDHVAIGPYAIIERQARIGDHTVIYGGSYIGHHAVIGANCLIYPNVTIRERVVLGNNVTIHSGTVIGSDGFGYVQVEGVHKKIPQIGTVVIGDDVEIGANVTIDRARFDKTVIGRGTKIDNLVQIGHNVVMGENCIVVSLVGISGSVNIGKGVILAGQAGVTGHISIGDGVLVYSQSAVAKSVSPYAQVSGSPARPHAQAKRVHAYTQRLPHYVDLIKDLQKRVDALEVKQKGQDG